MYSTVSFSIENIEKHRNQFLTEVTGNIIPAIKYYPEKIKELKIDLNQLDEFASEVVKKSNKLTIAKQANDMAKVNQITVNFLLKIARFE